MTRTQRKAVARRLLGGVILLLWGGLFLAVFYLPRLRRYWDEAAPGEPLSGLQLLAVRVSMFAQHNALPIAGYLFCATIAVITWLIISCRQTEGNGAANKADAGDARTSHP